MSGFCVWFVIYECWLGACNLVGMCIDIGTMVGMCMIDYVKLLYIT